MFYCDECGEKKGWPCGLSDSYGPCEVCGKSAACNSVKSKNLPDPKCIHCGEDTAITCDICEKPVCYDCAKNSMDDEPICKECKRKETIESGRHN